MLDYLFKEIDEKKTKAKADELLSHYFKLKRIAGRPVKQNLTATLSDEPKGTEYKNKSKIEKGVQRKVDASSIIDDIHYVIDQCISLDARRRLTSKYLTPMLQYDYEIYTELGESHATFYKKLGEAQIEFAESYHGGELLVYISKETEE
ncbi:hypothetical protein B8A46_05440 [Dolosigranulum pigrum]|uniref:ArpU family phage packaging/lysis transcriptional regulator n=1 Tax=Dolosigranulum pigrum TaxID=29394 RepID=UPI000DC01F2A|nr:ArpU family phage packaging/lysis transcriptional regulator [Dolosigranulum pigrum]RAN59826.1 hypothetical protein B8A46_05440 [Dolosigranulum pigrum]